MDRNSTLMLISVVAVAALIGGVALSTYSYNPLPRQEDTNGLLTGEQRDEIRQIIQDMRVETKAKIDAKLTEWGLEPPILTDQQKTELQQLKEELRHNRATRDEVKAAVESKLEEWGIEFPVLTEKQREEIHQIIKEMRQETESIIDAKFEEWEIDPPERMCSPNRRWKPRRFRMLP